MSEAVEGVESLEATTIDTPVEAISDADLDWDNIPTMEQAEVAEKGEAKDEDWTEEVETESKEVVEESKEEVKEETTEESILESKEEDKEEVVVEDIEVKIDGEIEKVSLEDLKSNYSGKIAYDKKFTELDNERQSHQQDVEEINNYINTFASKARSGDMVSAMEYFGEFAGIPPYQMKEMLLSQLSNEVYRRETLTEEELNLEQSQAKVKFDTEDLKSKQEASSKEQAKLDLDRQIMNVREAYNVSDSEWNEAFSELDELLEPHENITPEMVGKYADAVRLDNKAVNILSEFEDRVEANDEVIENLSEFIRAKSSWSDEQIKDQIRAELDALEEKNVKSELSETVEKKESKKQVKTSKVDNGYKPIHDEYGDEVEDFDDL